MKPTVLSIFLFAYFFGSAQDAPTLKLVNPSRDVANVTAAKQFIIGSTCKSCSVNINGKNVKVYTTGAFGMELALDTGRTIFTIVSTNTMGKSTTKTVTYKYSIAKPVVAVSTPEIEWIKTFPEGNLILMPGDKILFKVKALPGSIVTTYKNTLLYELPVSQAGIAGIYQGEYIIKDTDYLAAQPIAVTLQAKNGILVKNVTDAKMATMPSFAPDVVLTKGKLAHLEYGLGDDRLGGSKIGYLDENIPLKVVGKVGSDYKIRLAKDRVAYIPDDLVTAAPKGTVATTSLTSNWRVYGDSLYDYVTVALETKLPYQSMQLINPSQVVVDVFGAVNNSNWITQLQSAQEISNVDFEQVSDDVYRIHIYLKHKQHWGHKIFYKGNNLVIRIKRQPPNLTSLKGLTIAVDAGHGGSNTGAYGAAGTSEKEMTLALSLLVERMLEDEGATVVMCRSTERFFDNKERILFYRDYDPTLLISIHLNSAVDPFKTEGTSTYYKYLGFRPLSQAILKRMLELGLKEYGNVGSFNFMLNSPIEYPNALVEALFVSNFEEEELINQDSFRRQLALKIVQGIKDFLKQAGEN